eukprot:617556-Amorphochlora_amoeboformis.AAC.1
MKKTNRKAPVVAFHRQLGAENPHFPLLSSCFLLANWKVLPIGKPGRKRWGERVGSKGLGRKGCSSYIPEEHGRSIHENGKISHGRNGSRNCTRLPESLHMLDNPK